MVLWPSWADFDLTQGPDAFLAACQRLTAVPIGDRPSAEQQELVDLILARANPNPSSRAQVVGSVCRAACAWHDGELWGRALDACGAGATVESVGFDEFCDAVKAFGFVNVRARWGCHFYCARTCADSPSLLTELRQRWSEILQIWQFCSSFGTLRSG